VVTIKSSATADRDGGLEHAKRELEEQPEAAPNAKTTMVDRPFAETDEHLGTAFQLWLDLRSFRV